MRSGPARLPSQDMGCVYMCTDLNRDKVVYIYMCAVRDKEGFNIHSYKVTLYRSPVYL